MCQVCKLEGVDWKFRNGEKQSISRGIFYRVYEGELKVVHLCKICSVELFHVGETRFLSKHPLLAIDFTKRTKAASNDEFDFSFA